jgi:hypothetical protein
VPYFHLVFTLPNVLDPLALANPRIVYDLLLRSAAETVLQVAANPDRLGARTGVLAVLHTWGQTLQFHPHVHCVVPGGGLSPDGARWVGSRRDYFLPAPVLSRVFRGKFLAGLRVAYTAGRLRFARQPTDQTAADARFEQLVSAAVRTDWVVHAKRPFGGPDVVLKYLARYTHRVAISNSRLLDLTEGRVRFRYKDYAHGNHKRLMTLRASEFVRRLLLHVVPRSFVRIRHYGLWSNRRRREELALCRRLLEGDAAPEAQLLESEKFSESLASVTPTRSCPNCGAARMIVVEEFPPLAAKVEQVAGGDACAVVDSS